MRDREAGSVEYFVDRLAELARYLHGEPTTPP